MAIAPERMGIGIRRSFTTAGQDPYETVVWERRDARITHWATGAVAFEQLGVEVPSGWSVNATNILAQKYFRGALGTSERESSLKQVADRVVDTITAWGRKDGYFVDDAEAEIFSDELKYAIIHQKAAFNSPVWFNIGVEGVPKQASACFILSVDDSMDSILNWYTEEGTIFKGGSGAGVNLSRIRSSKEGLRGGGTASGPVSFMRGADASAGTIKSGGKTRRAAKMVILNVDHPDIQDFIWCKAIEERKARALRDAGFDMDLDGKDSHSIQYQNANNSVRVTDEFMNAVIDDSEWHLRAVTDGSIVETMRARDLFRELAEAAWQCADPGLQYDTTINKWHTSPNSGRINGSNPCFTGDALVHTDKGLIAFRELFARANEGESFGVYTHDATNPDLPAERLELTRPDAFMITGTNDIVRLRFDNGMEVRCTAGHRFFTVNRGYVEAKDLGADDRVKVLDLPAPAIAADLRLPVATDAATYRRKGDHARLVQLPEKWSPELAHYMGWLVGDGSVARNGTISAVDGSQEDRVSVLPRHSELVTEINGGVTPEVGSQADAARQQRLSRRAITEFFAALGLHAGRGPDKRVPWSLLQAPSEIVAGFLQGLFDADGCVRTDEVKGSYVGLGSSSRELLVDVQRLLTTFGIACSIYDTAGPGRTASSHVRADATCATYERHAMYELRISASSIAVFARSIGFSLPSKEEELQSLLSGRGREFCETDVTTRLAERIDDGQELTYNLSEPRNHSYVVNGLVVRNCSEYMHVDNSACNLASLNLLTFLTPDGTFDVEGFRATVEVVFTAQEILVGNADYPTEAIADNSRKFRQLGIGYANLGALLMAEGLPYDSDGGRAWAAAITALLTGHAYATSARTAARMGPFAGFTANRDAMLGVLRMHRDAAAEIDEELVPPEILSAAQESWDNCVEIALEYGVRNAQASVLAPTGTIGLLMDCDTTGVEPDLGLVKTKKLVGGGTMSIVNQTIPRALTRLGYSATQVEEIIAHIDEHKSILGAPHLSADHLAVFACSMGDNTIHYRGHLRMMGAVQPFISGAISKCVVGDTLVATADGLVRIGGLHRDEAADTFRPEIVEVASLGGPTKTDAFYYGGVRPVRTATLRSGHRVTGTPNHRLLVAGDGGLDWRRLDEIAPDDWVAIQYGDDMWSPLPARFDDFQSSEADRSTVRTPTEMSDDLALILGAYAAEGDTSRTAWTVTITNPADAVLDDVAAAFERVFGVTASIFRRADGGTSVQVRSRAVVEFLEYLGCGADASSKRIPDAVLRSPRAHVLTFLRGLALEANCVADGGPRWAIGVDSPVLLDDLQAVLTNLGVVHGRVSRHDPDLGRSYDEVVATGVEAQKLLGLVPFLEPDKAATAERLLRRVAEPYATSDVIPGITPAALYDLLPGGRSDLGEADASVRWRYGFLLDARTVNVTRRSLERVAAEPGVHLPEWLQTVLADDLHFSPVRTVVDEGRREVYDLSVPATKAFVGNGVVNHNTVNVPEDVTVEDVEQLHIEAWQLGIKAVAIYRDNCKVAQPLATTKKAADGEGSVTSDAGRHDAELARKVAELEKALSRQTTVVVKQPIRERMPRRRRSSTWGFRVADCEGYVTVGEYEDGRPGEVFMKVAKQGSTLAGIMDAFAISVSLGLQHGVPLATYVKKYTNMRFEPAGMTDDPDLRIAQSLVDYIFRRLAVDYLPYDERLELGVLTSAERTQQTLPGVDEAVTPNLSLVDDGPIELEEPAPPVGRTPNPPAVHPVPAPVESDAPYCFQCGVQMQRAGSCHACPSCGTTSGCS